MKRVALAKVVLFLLFASVEGLCQSARSYTDLPQEKGSSPSELQSQEVRTRNWLPDAPSVDAEHPSRILGTTAINAATPGSQANFVALSAAVTPTDSSTFFDRYLYPSLARRNSRYRPATGGSFIRRATDAASRLFITRDDSGKGRVNDSYFSSMLTSVVVQTAYTPYWSRSTSTPFTDFGSTLGSDVGLNVFHEFEPDIRQVIMAHTPKFVSRIEDYVSLSR